MEMLPHSQESGPIGDPVDDLAEHKARWMPSKRVHAFYVRNDYDMKVGICLPAMRIGADFSSAVLQRTRNKLMYEFKGQQRLYMHTIPRC